MLKHSNDIITGHYEYTTKGHCLNGTERTLNLLCPCKTDTEVATLCFLKIGIFHY